MTIQMFYVMAFACAMSLAFSGFMIHVGIGDVPEGRSNHKQTTPTSGGVGLIAALGGLFLILPQFFEISWILQEWPMVLSILWAVGLLGLIDDAFTIHIGLKFVLLTFLAALAVWIIGPVRALPYADTLIGLPYWVGFVGSLLWIFVVTNIVNFMDGSNGLMATVMSLACIGLVVIGSSMGAFHAILVPLALAAGLIGFLPYNLRTRALVFSGDSGSLIVGFGFAISVLWLCRELPLSMPVFVGPVLLLPFLADALLTLLRRAKHKENVFKPHKTHIYQRMIIDGQSHVAVALYYGLATLCVSIFAWFATQSGYHRYTAFLLLPTLMFTMIYYVMTWHLGRKGV